MKYKFSRNWYEFQTNTLEDTNKVFSWCKEKFGLPPIFDAWSRWNYDLNGTILFRDEKDYLLCVLTWG